jgi:hypothetical protein
VRLEVKQVALNLLSDAAMYTFLAGEILHEMSKEAEHH